MWSKQKLIGLSIASAVTMVPIVLLTSDVSAEAAATPIPFAYMIGFVVGVAVASAILGLAWAALATAIWHGFKGRLIIASLVSVVTLFTLAWNMPIIEVGIMLSLPAFGGMTHVTWRLLKLVRLVPAEPVDHSPLATVFA